MQQTAQRKPVKWVTDRYLSEYYSVSRVSIWRWVKIGKLPAPQKIGENTTRWDFDEITAAETQA
jgi:predicted DNA-binding transcriptional regulator AlpA